MEAVKWGWVNMLAIEEHDMGLPASVSKNQKHEKEERFFQQLLDISYFHATICSNL